MSAVLGQVGVRHSSKIHVMFENGDCIARSNHLELPEYSVEPSGKPGLFRFVSVAQALPITKRVCLVVPHPDLVANAEISGPYILPPGFSGPIEFLVRPVNKDFDLTKLSHYVTIYLLDSNV